MILIFEFLAGIFEPLLLLVGAIFAYLLGNAAISAINSFLYSIDTPCLEVITLIIAFVSPLGYLYGANHKKFFSQRSNRHNLNVFLISFVFGIAVTFFPINYNYTLNGTEAFCPNQITFIDQIGQSISTGTITAIVAFLSLDLGVIYANTIGAHVRKIRTSKKNKK